MEEEEEEEEEVEGVELKKEKRNMRADGGQRCKKSHRTRIENTVQI